uniref:Uncharacterized protein n=3 Tax=Setaria italica TaxID=4555 RepID=K3YMV7_SETIT
MFMGYVSMAIRGLGYLVLTWTTVVLLGGFVSLLQEKDFWALTVITLVQTTGVFNVFLKEKLRNILYSLMGLMISMVNCEAEAESLSAVMIMMAVGFATLLQVLVVAVILLPLGAVYVFGLYISTGISLWRLIQHDYAEADGDPNKANLRPALVVLYSLALVQGALLCYRAIFSISMREQVFVNATLERYHFKGDAVQSALDYFHDTMAGCEKNPSFARGTNLITYASDLMGSTSPDRYLSGIRILDTLLMKEKEGPIRTLVVQRLLVSEPSTVWKLLRTLDATMPYGVEARLRAARILEHLAGDIYLDQFPGGMRCIASLLDHEASPSRPQLRREEVPVLQGMRILRNLAANSGNLGAIRSAPGLLAKITAPLDPDLLQLHHTYRFKVALESLILVRRLMDMDAPRESKDDDECLEYLKKAVTNAMPKVLRHVLQLQTELQAPTDTHTFSAPGTDLEEGPVSHATDRPNSQQQPKAIELRDALLSECATACEKLVGEDQNLARRLDEIAAQICSDAGKTAMSWAALLRD